MLQDKGYAKIVSENNVLDEEYKYLVRMPMDSVSTENVDKLNSEHDRKQEELAEIKATTCQQMWLRELVALEQEYNNYRDDREESMNGLVAKKPKMVVKGLKKVVNKKVQLEIV